jgi:hypothetical protein
VIRVPLVDGLCDPLAPKISAFLNSSDIISAPYDRDVIGLPKESKLKAASNKNKQLSTFCSFSHGIRVQMLLESTDSNYFLAYLACRRRGRKRTCHVIWLFLDKRSGQYRRSPSPQNVAEAKINYHTGYKTTLEDVYISQPPSDFAQHQVQYQIRGSYDEPNSEFLLYVEDDLAQVAGFTSVTYVPEVWKLLFLFLIVFSFCEMLIWESAGPEAACRPGRQSSKSWNSPLED